MSATQATEETPKKGSNGWNSDKDVIFMREMASEGVFSHPSGSRERGNAWLNVATRLSSMNNFSISVNNPQKSLRDRFSIIARKQKLKNASEIKATGLGGEESSEYDLLLDDLIELSEEADLKKEQDSRQKKEIKEKDANKAKEVRQVAMERMGDTRKRRSSVDEEDDDQTTPKRSRRTSSDTMAFLKEKLAMEKDLKREEQKERAKHNELVANQIAAQQQQSNDTLALFREQMQQQIQQQNLMQKQIMAMFAMMNQNKGQ